MNNLGTESLHDEKFDFSCKRKIINVHDAQMFVVAALEIMEHRKMPAIPKTDEDLELDVEAEIAIDYYDNLYLEGSFIAYQIFEFLFEHKWTGSFDEIRYGKYLISTGIFRCLLACICQGVDKIAERKASLKGKRNRHRRRKMNRQINVLTAAGIFLKRSHEPKPFKIHVDGDKGSRHFYDALEKLFMDKEYGIEVEVVRIGEKFRFCDFCGKELTDWKSCPCKLAYYCGKECQKRDYKRHIKRWPCKAIREAKIAREKTSYANLVRDTRPYVKRWEKWVKEASVVDSNKVMHQMVRDGLVREDWLEMTKEMVKRGIATVEDERFIDVPDIEALIEFESQYKK